MCHVTFYFYSKYTIGDVNHLIDTFQIFEMGKKLWWRYLSFCLQKLSPLKDGLNFEPKT